MKKWHQVSIALTIIALIIASLLRILTSLQNYTLIGTNIPANQTVNVLHRLDLQFNKAVSDDFVKKCQLVFTPPTEFTLNAAGEILQIEPTTRLKPDTKYNVKGKCDYVSLDLVFQTTGLENLSDEELQILQTQLDYEFATELKNVYEQQPWRAQLPLTTDNYNLVYSQLENVYLVRLTLPPTNPPTKEALTLEINQKLKEIGAPELELVWR